MWRAWTLAALDGLPSRAAGVGRARHPGGRRPLRGPVRRRRPRVRRGRAALARGGAGGAGGASRGAPGGREAAVHVDELRAHRRGPQPAQPRVGRREVQVAALVLDPVARHVQEQQVIGPAVGEELLDRQVDLVRGLVEQRANLEATDRGVAQHPRERLGIAGGRAQPPQARVVVVGAGDDQRSGSRPSPVSHPCGGSATRRSAAAAPPTTARSAPARRRPSGA